MQRGWMDHKLFRREPYNRRNAWEWLIEHAAFAEHGDLQRGQLRYSISYLANAWGWDRDQVRRFLKNCRAASAICYEPATAADIRGSLITICNYEKYQSDESAGATPGATSAPQGRHKRAPNNKKEEGNKEELPNGSRQSARQIALEMVEVWKEVFGEALSVPRKLTDARIRASRARFVDEFASDRDAWRAFLERVRASPFLMGDNDRQWRIDFDFAIKPASIAKITEGKYDRQPTGSAQLVLTEQQKREREERILAEFSQFGPSGSVEKNGYDGDGNRSATAD